MLEIFNQYISQGVYYVVHYGDLILRPILVTVFAGAILLRWIIYLTVRAEAAFAQEFEKRVHKHLADPAYEPGINSFHELTKRLLERTHQEHYNLRRKYRRRRFDQITSLADRIFLVVEGAQRVIVDTLSQTKYLRKEGQPPRFVDISKFVFESNPVFNRVLGLFPLGMFNEILNILPGLFVVGGIFGTFLGVMDALPALSQIDVADPAKTKLVMDKFLLNMAFSMGNSIVGILFSVCLTVLNAMLNPEGIYYSMVNKFTSAMEFLWNDTTNNEVTDMGAYSTDRRAVSFTNSAKKTEPPRPPAAAADVTFLAEPLSAVDPEPASSEDDRLVILNHRLAVLDTYLKKADEDRSTGLMSEEMWNDETTAYREERERVEAEIRDLESGGKRAA